MQKTEYFQLNQWDAADPIRREDFNADNVAIETAIAAKSEVVCGTYMGNGASTQTISLGFQPKAVLVEYTFGIRSDAIGIYGGLAQPGVPLAYGGYTALSVTSSGFRVYYVHGYTELNAANCQFLYIAFK